MSLEMDFEMKENLENNIEKLNVKDMVSCAAQKRNEKFYIYINRSYFCGNACVQISYTSFTSKSKLMSKVRKLCSFCYDFMASSVFSI